MGMGKICAHLLLEGKKEIYKGKILQLGRQYILFDHSFLKECAQQHHFSLSPVKDIELSFDDELKKKGYLNDTSFFKLLGFDQVDSLDYSPYEKASIIWDLNQPIPEKYWNQYDMIFDGGTAEHVFHFPQFVENVFRMLKPGGTIIHLSPSHNYVDHGFYMFSPTLYYEYYAVNNFKIIQSLLLESFSRPRLVNVYPYLPGCLKKLDRGGFGKQVLDIFFSAQKMENSTSGVIPQQLSNQLIWAREPNEALPARPKKSLPSKVWRNTVKPCLKILFPSTPKMPAKKASYRDV